ncbi:hypothetical protein DFH11DRAFT_1884036 [Phellopilus nigrolimitatus]|nr:hypothetical protein DFH11DRAFT_1884036 [Phellopilus nigrolimitatus]
MSKLYIHSFLRLHHHQPSSSLSPPPPPPPRPHRSHRRPLLSSPLPFSSSPPPSDVLAATSLVLAATPSLMFAARPHTLNREENKAGLEARERKAIALAAYQQQQLQMQRQAVSSVPASDVLAYGFTHLNSPLHPSSTSSLLLNHAAQLTAAQAPSQLALLLSSALADAVALRRELTRSLGPNVDGEKTSGEREREKNVKAESKVPGSAMKAVPDAEAHADRAECAHVDLAASLQSLVGGWDMEADSPSLSPPQHDVRPPPSRLDQNVNDDLAMCASPGAPGAIDATPRTRTNTLTLNTRNVTREHHHHGHAHGREELTPRAVLASLPMHTHAHPPMPVAMPVAADGANAGPARSSPARGAAGGSNLGSPVQATRGALALPAPAAASPSPAATGPTPCATHRHHHHHHHHHHLLAYLSKYPHVRQAFYKPRLSFHPATATGSAGTPSTSATAAGARDSSSWRGGAWTRTGTTASAHSAATASADLKKDGFFKALTGRGKEKEKAITISSGLNPPSPTSPSSSASPRMTNVFSLVERFTFRPSPTESSLPTPPPFLPPEIQYWAGVIMRNACRKDESRGGIRQCANMLCGKWESFPAREGDDIAEGAPGVGQGQKAEGDGDSTEGAVASIGVGSGSGSGGRTVSTIAHDRVERRLARDRERQRLASAAAASLAGMQPAAHFLVARNNGTPANSAIAIVGHDPSSTILTRNSTSTSSRAGQGEREKARRRRGALRAFNIQQDQVPTPSSMTDDHRQRCRSTKCGSRSKLPKKTWASPTSDAFELLEHPLSPASARADGASRPASSTGSFPPFL